MIRTHKFRNKLPEAERSEVARLAAATLHTDLGVDALKYMADIRHIDDQILRDFHVGYVPQHIKNIHGDQHEFAGRIVLPVFDQHDQLVALSSRDWRENAFMKFFHEQYIKSNYLYGLNVAKKNIIHHDKAIIVEGELDVMTSHSVGLNMTVGLMGSALSLKQIGLLSRYCQTIFFVADGDVAGVNAAKKAAQIETVRGVTEGADIQFHTVYLPENHDPDSFINTHGKDSYMNRLKHAKENEIL